jgi:hypothetical protein
MRQAARSTVSSARRALVAPIVPALVGLWLAGCSGDMGAPAAGGKGGPGDQGSTADKGGASIPTAGPMAPAVREDAVCGSGLDAKRLAPAGVRRLNRIEYLNTVERLLGPSMLTVADLAVDPQDGHFDNDAEQLRASPTILHKYTDAAERLADALAIDHLRGDCAGLPPEGADCAKKFGAGFVARAFRRALTPAELATVERLAAVPGSTPLAGAKLVVQYALQSPHFLYRRELGQAVSGQPGIVRLSDEETASALSYYLTESAPDEELASAARAGKLRERADLARHAERLLATPAGRKTVGRFLAQWLGLARDPELLEKDSAVYPTFSPELAASMYRESARFLEDAFWDRSSAVSQLFTAPHGFVDGRLAALYGLPPRSGDALVEVELPAAERKGLLTQASLLATYALQTSSSPIARGVLVLERLLCAHVPPPDPSVIVMNREIVPGQTTRERYAAHSSNPACAACHKSLDGIGFGFEAYDGIGAFRTMEAGKPVDASGELVSTDVDGPYVGALELQERLARSQQVRQCFGEHVVRYALGRKVTEDQRCMAEALAGATGQPEPALRAYMLAFVQTDAFVHRRVTGAASKEQP